MTDILSELSSGSSTLIGGVGEVIAQLFETIAGLFDGGSSADVE